MTLPLQAEFAGLDIQYSLFIEVDKQILTMLWVAEKRGLLEFYGATPDSYYLVFVHGNPLLLRADEVQGFVLGLHRQAGLDLSPVAYRTGLAPNPHGTPAVDGE